MASAISNDHVMKVNFFTVALLKLQAFDFNNLNKSNKLVLKLKYLSSY